MRKRPSAQIDSVPFAVISELLNDLGSQVNRDTALLAADIAEFPLDEGDPRVARRNQQIGAIGAKQAFLADLGARLEVFSLEQNSRLDTIEGFEHQPDVDK